MNVSSIPSLLLGRQYDIEVTSVVTFESTVTQSLSEALVSHLPDGDGDSGTCLMLFILTWECSF